MQLLKDSAVGQNVEKSDRHSRAEVECCGQIETVDLVDEDVSFDGTDICLTSGIVAQYGLHQRSAARIILPFHWYLPWTHAAHVSIDNECTFLHSRGQG